MGKPYVYMPIGSPIRERMLAVGQAIPPDDLDPEGVEDNPHITILYGLPTEDPEEVRKALQSPALPFARTMFLRVTRWQHNRRDVLVLLADGSALFKYHERLCSAFDMTSPGLNAHATIAYLSKRAEVNLADVHDVLVRYPEQIVAKHLVFMDSRKQPYEISLGEVVK